MLKRRLSFLGAALLCCQMVNAQYLMDMVDTSKNMGKGMLALYNRLDKIRLSGYIQPQFQVAESRGAKNYSGGDFSRTATAVLCYAGPAFVLITCIILQSPTDFPCSLFFNTILPKEVPMSEMYGRFFENKYKLFSFTTGLFARPFSYELNLSSADRESPERGRMTQAITKIERDLGEARRPSFSA